MTDPDPTRAERAYYGDGPMRWWQFWRPHWPCPDPPRIFPSGRQGATMSDPLADLLDDVPNLRQDRDTGAVAYVRPSGVVLADAIRAALSDGSLSLGDLGATQTLPECTCSELGWVRESDIHHLDCAIEQTEWWRFPEGGGR